MVSFFTVLAGFTTGASAFLTSATLTTGVVSFFTVSAFLTVLVVLTSGALTTGAELVSLFSALGASTFTGVVLAGSALTASF